MVKSHPQGPVAADRPNDPPQGTQVPVVSQLPEATPTPDVLVGENAAAVVAATAAEVVDREAIAVAVAHEAILDADKPVFAAI